MNELQTILAGTCYTAAFLADQSPNEVLEGGRRASGPRPRQARRRTPQLPRCQRPGGAGGSWNRRTFVVLIGVRPFAATVTWTKTMRLAPSWPEAGGRQLGR